MSRIRILEVVEATTGGTRRHVTDLVCGIDPERFDVTVFCSTLRDSGFGEDIRRMREAGARVEVVQMAREISPVRDLIAFAALLRRMRGGSFDVVHTHSSKAGILGRVAARAAGVGTIIHTPHVFAFQMRTGGAFKAFYRMIEKAVSGITDRYVCVSASEFDAASAAGIAPDAKFTVIENGIRMSDAGTPAGRAAACRRLGLDPACRIVGSAGRFAAQKGLIYLVESAPPVLDCFPDSRFVLVGDGEERPRIERRLDELSLRRSFILPGRVEDAASLYQAFDVFVLPSLWESLPYSLIEAMAAGNAVVASNVGGVPEALDDGAGVLVPPADAGALSEAIIRLLGNPASGKALGAAARQRAAARYSLDTMLSRTSSLYVSALAEAGDG